MIKKLKILMDVFAKITLGVLLASAAYISAIWGFDAQISVQILWQILIVSAVCSIPILMFPADDEKELSKKGMLVRHFIYFVYVNGTVLGFGTLFEWFSTDKPEMVILMEILIVFVYAGVNLIYYMNDHAEAEKMNQKLDEMKKKERRR